MDEFQDNNLTPHAQDNLGVAFQVTTATQSDARQGLYTSNERHPVYMGTQRSIVDNIYALLTKHIKVRTHMKVVEPFCGSTSMTRHFRKNKWHVTAADHEVFATDWARYALTCDPLELKKEEKVLASKLNIKVGECIYNALTTYVEELNATAYFAVHYSPSETSERRYFIPSTAKWFDNCMSLLQSDFFKEIPLLKSYVQSEMLSLMIRCANISSTMKSYHAQWGGGTQTRLHEINQQPRIEQPWCISGPKGTVYNTDAIELASFVSCADVVYLDPPASVHQYSSSYHLLTTFSKGDYWTPPSNDKHGTKAGIRSDCHSSALSKPSEALEYFKKLIDIWQHKAPYLVVTYPVNGLIDKKTLALVLHQHGQNHVSIEYTNGYHIFIVETYTWQSPTQLRKLLKQECVQQEDELEYLKPEMLPKAFCKKIDGKNINLFVEGILTATIHYTRKVKWISTGHLNQEHWSALKQAQCDNDELFNIYLAEKLWVKAIKILRLWKRNKANKTYVEKWNMLYYLLKMQGQTKYQRKLEELK